MGREHPARRGGGQMGSAAGGPYTYAPIGAKPKSYLAIQSKQSSTFSFTFR